MNAHFSLRTLGGLLILTFGLFSCSQGKDSAKKIESEHDKTVYSLGVTLAKNLSKLNLNQAELGVLKQGLSDEILKKEHAVDPALYQTKIKELFDERIYAQTKVEQEKSTAFIEKFKKENPNAVELEGGLLYLETKKGEGKKPDPKSTVKVRYTGKLANGDIFDSTENRDQPAEFPLNRVIRGWQLGIVKMAEGGKATLVIPAELGYGDTGSPPSIPGGAVLVFDVELITVN